MNKVKTNTERIDYFKKILDKLPKYVEKYDQLKNKLPYQINVIDELHANENANSRILKGLFKHTFDGKYEILKDFKNNLLENFNIDISSPIITDEKHRIDLLIQEKNKYAIIFENKINNACFQPNQLARYIDKVKNLGYTEEQIFIIHLPPNKNYEVSEDCWLKDNNNESYRESFKDRFITLSFKEDILPWLENYILPNCKVKDIYLQSAITQYIDHLKGKFNLRENNKIMNKELQDHLTTELRLEELTVKGETLKGSTVEKKNNRRIQNN